VRSATLGGAKKNRRLSSQKAGSECQQIYNTLDLNIIYMNDLPTLNQCKN
jgi:hypothetical protein